MTYVLFVCNHNAGRSQMAQAFFERDAPPGAEAESAGTNPGEQVWPEVVEVMREVGIDLSSRTPKKLTVEMQQRADLAVTMGCGDACPYIPGKQYIDWELPDPKGLQVDQVRAIRDDISQKVTALAAELNAES